MLSRWRKFWGLKGEQRAMLVEAAWWLLLAKIAIRFLSFQRIAFRLGKPMTQTLNEFRDPAEALVSHQVSWAIRVLARTFPLDAKCLTQAVAGKWMLQRRGLPSTLYIGVDRGQETWLEAHAWLRCGGEIVTGATQRERFKIIASFAEEDL